MTKKTPNYPQIRCRRNIVNIMKATYDRPIKQYYTYLGKAEELPLRNGTRRGWPILLLLLSTILEVLAKSNWEERKDTSMKKQKAKIYVFVDDIILFMAKTKPKNMLELFTSLLNLLNIQTAVFDRPIMNSLKEKSKRKSHLPMT